MRHQLRQVVDRTRANGNRDGIGLAERRPQFLHACVFRIDVRAEDEGGLGAEAILGETVGDVAAGGLVCVPVRYNDGARAAEFGLEDLLDATARSRLYDETAGVAGGVESARQQLFVIFRDGRHG